MTTPGAKGAGRRDAYRAAGVDVAAGDRAVELMRAARRVDPPPGGRRRSRRLRRRRSRIPTGYREPMLVASTDGVGTKTAIAASLRRYDTIGVDLVAMCADDVVCCGAEPLAFVDYVAVGHVDPGVGGGAGRRRSRPAAVTRAARSSAARRRSTRT